MRGGYGGKNGNRDFLGEGGDGKGCGIAWDSPQRPLYQLAIFNKKGLAFGN
jgi:hypothetical protein